MITDKLKQLGLCVLIAVIIIGAWLLAASRIKSCACKDPENKTAMLGVRDSSAQLVIEELAKDTASKRKIIDSLISESVGNSKVIYINNRKLQSELSAIEKTNSDKLLFDLRVAWGTADSRLPRIYGLDSLEIKTVASEHATNKSLKRNEELYKTQVNNLKLADARSKELINDLRGMLYQKDVQIVKFENTPQTVITYSSEPDFKFTGSVNIHYQNQIKRLREYYKARVYGSVEAGIQYKKVPVLIHYDTKDYDELSIKTGIIF